ncbi:MAG TPA: tetratricopeptide repeat protein [Thermoplasmata archaeon]|nr:tetratricopeptide repeat protein [Thermoplasmata archaeon]
MTLAPHTTGRFLPSVDRLESAMHAARRAFERGDTDSALGQLGVALKLKPEYDAAWILKGHVLQRAGSQEAALDSFMQSLKCNGDSKEGWMGLASALHELGRLKEEAEAYDRLLAFDPLSIEAWIDKGAVLHELGDYSGAIRCYEEVLALRPEHAAAWNNKGAALLRLGQEAEATRCFEEALYLDPDCVDAMANRVYLYETKAYHGEAVLWADRALRIREAPGFWYAKGLAHLGLLESTLAIRSFERALALDPTLKEAKAALGRATALRQKSDFYRGAYECFGTHLAGDPGCEECEIRPRCREVTP